MLAQWKSTCFTSRKLVVWFHRALTSIWNADDQFLVKEALLTITNEIWWHFSTVTKIWNGDNQKTPPYICINSDKYKNSITIYRCCSYEMVMVTIDHYNHYSWQTLNATITPILLATFNFLAMEAKVHHHWSYKIVTITIHHYKLLLVTDFECHYNTYTFGDATFDDVQFLVTKALLTVTNDLMVTFFAPHQCPFFL